MNSTEIREMLDREFGVETNWGMKIDEISKNYRKKNEKDKKEDHFWGDSNGNLRKRFYKHIIPDHLEVLSNINEYMNRSRKESEVVRAGEYDFGIYLIGFSEDPTILSLGFMRPRNIYFIFSEESEIMIKKIKTALGYFDEEMQERIIRAEKNDQFFELSDSSDPAEIFKVIRDVIEQVKNREPEKKIMVDITGGKKTMVSGAFSSTSLFDDVDIVYVDFGSYDPGDRKPVYCTEFMAKLQNPNKIYRYTDMERIKGLFDNYRYDIAIEDIDRQLRAMGQYSEDYYGKEIDELNKLKKWAEIYNYWDQYNYSEVSKSVEDVVTVHGPDKRGKSLLEQIGQSFSLIGQENPSYILQKLFYDVVDNKENIEQVFKFIAIDRYCNAVRRKDTDNEGYIVRLCSIIEILTYYYLIKNHDCLNITKKNNSRIKDTEIVELIYGDYSREKKHGELQSVKSRVKIINGGKVKGRNGYNFEWKKGECRNRLVFVDKSLCEELAEIIYKRNESSITHSVGVVDAEKADEYKKVIKEFIIWIFEMKSGEFENLEEIIKFRNSGEILNHVYREYP